MLLKPESPMRFAMSLLVALVVPSAAGAQQPKEVKTIKGKPIGLVNLLSIKPDCSAGVVGVPVLSKPPHHGSIVMNVVIADLKASSSCADRKSPIIVLVYVPATDFVGVDTVTIEIPDTNKTTSVSYQLLVSEPGDKL